MPAAFQGRNQNVEDTSGAVFSSPPEDSAEEADSKETMSAVTAPVRHDERQQRPLKQPPLGWAHLLGVALRTLNTVHRHARPEWNNKVSSRLPILWRRNPAPITKEGSASVEETPLKPNQLYVNSAFSEIAD
jgi:hypothetical protein